MLRGIFMPPGVDQEAVDFYVDLFEKVRETPEWQEFMANGAFNPTSMPGDEFKAWLGETADAAQGADDRGRLHRRPTEPVGLRRPFRRRSRSSWRRGIRQERP